MQTQEIDFHEAVSGMGSVINTPRMSVSHNFQFTLDDWLDLSDNLSFDQIWEMIYPSNLTYQVRVLVPWSLMIQEGGPIAYPQVFIRKFLFL